MSEYRYYEFQAIDRPLTAKQMDELRSYSTRARITPTSFVNDYAWGNFKGNQDAWMENYFDAFLYLANWGTHVLKLRLRSLEELKGVVTSVTRENRALSRWLARDNAYLPERHTSSPRHAVARIVLTYPSRQAAWQHPGCASTQAPAERQGHTESLTRTATVPSCPGRKRLDHAAGSRGSLHQEASSGLGWQACAGLQDLARDTCENASGSVIVEGRRSRAARSNRSR